ncbi:MAG: FKBP-type peptidyl-prolyl cis-trans isomerase, partial [Gammaproteobacteria bacterium]|nr:FKBP-type peptidyl-prolyl cis-trans isomerase [Gammaproteobacteria bacterium]
MKSVFKFVLMAIFLAAFNPVSASELKSDKEKYSYAFGFIMANNIVNQLKASGVSEIDTAAFVAAMTDVLDDKPLRLDVQAMQQALDKQRDKILDTKKQAAQATLDEGKAFQDKHKSEDGVVVLENGLQYKVLKAGEGKQPAAEDTVEVHYHGTLVDGTVFDSSVERGSPASFPLNGVIPGFREAITRMKTGGKWKVVMPSD